MKTTIAGRYKLLDEIGRGSLGVVYQAEDERLQRKVAIKVLHAYLYEQDERTPDTQDDYSTTLVEHARITASIQHPNVMPIYDLIDEDDGLAIVMPLVLGRWQDLVTYAIKRPLLETVRFLQRLADGLDFLHTNDIVHRDLKPSDVLIGDDNQPYIADFGVAQDIDVYSTSDEVISYALTYVAPENLLNSGEGGSLPSRDIYGFGMLTYELITGEHAFDPKSIADLVRMTTREPTPSIKSHRPELAPAITADIDDIIAKLTAKNPDERYKTASKAIDDLSQVVFDSEHVIQGKLFISYASEDRDYVHKLADELEQYHVNLWIDRNIEYGTKWDDSIDSQLKDCDLMLVIASPSAMQSYYVTYEWSHFIGADKPVLPFVPQAFDGKVELHARLDRIQYISGTGDVGQNARNIIETMTAISNQRSKGVREST